MGRKMYSYIEIHHLIRKRAHLVVETEHVIADFFGREDEIALSLFAAFKDYFARGSGYDVVDVKGAAALDLWRKGVRAGCGRRGKSSERGVVRRSRMRLSHLFARRGRKSRLFRWGSVCRLERW